MARSLIDELEELLFQDPKELYLKVRARRAGVRGSVPIIEPSSTGGGKARFKASSSPNIKNTPEIPTTKDTYGTSTTKDTYEIPTTELPDSLKRDTGVSKTPLPGDTYKGSGRDPYENQPAKPQPQDLEQATLQSFTLELPPSSTIQTATYWPSRQYLTVSFKSGHTYSYDEVPFQVMVAWKLAPSAGSFFYYNIRMTYRYRKI
jgi:hypothetical protein